MPHKYYGLIELTFSAIVALGFGGWQYWSVTRSIAKDKADRAGSPEDAGHAVGQHRLDDD
ncbi:hypothetical protein ACLB0R_11750 [Sphingomonas sp. GlSt437]|uniref:hypothetical protein n=1 Tax=Sphingomonas sp. GlSt437 TaxID=3389970 RepID=UPI003A88F958